MRKKKKNCQIKKGIYKLLHPREDSGFNDILTGHTHTHTPQQQQPMVKGGESEELSFTSLAASLITPSHRKGAEGQK